MTPGSRKLSWLVVILLCLALVAGALASDPARIAKEARLLLSAKPPFSANPSISPTTSPSQSVLETEPAEPPVTSGQLGKPPEPRQRYPHLEVAKPGELKTAKHKFSYERQSHTVAVEVDSAFYSAAKNADRMISYSYDESEEQRWSDYYRYMAQDPVQAPLIADTAEALRTIAKREDLGRDRYAELISKYVQSMPYDFAKLKAKDNSVRFPVQTIVDETGICGDKSVLLAALLAHEGYDVALLLFEAENHMAVGIKGPGDHYNDTEYLFVESTAPTYLSEIPDDFISGVKLESDPVVIPVGTGDREYKSADDVARIIGVREGAKGAQEKLYKEASASRLTREQARMVNQRLQSAYKAQFKLQVIEGDEQKFLDRRPALKWIAKNVWWD